MVFDPALEQVQWGHKVHARRRRCHRPPRTSGLVQVDGLPTGQEAILADHWFRINSLLPCLTGIQRVDDQDEVTFPLTGSPEAAAASTWANSRPSRQHRVNSLGMRYSTPRVNRRTLMIGALATAVAATVTACSSDKTHLPGPAPSDGPSSVELDVEGESFEPVIEMTSGSVAKVTWTDLDKGQILDLGTEPNLNIANTRRIGLFVTNGDLPAFDQVSAINLGFNHKEDAGEFNIGPQYDRPPQPVTRVKNIGLLTNLEKFCAGNTPLSGILDVSGLSRLQHIECYGAALESIELSGCSSLIRLCVEGCRVTSLDLNPVRKTLRDLRVAVQRSAGQGLTLTRLDGPLEMLYHYCTRDQIVHGSVPQSQLPAIEEYWAWNTGQKTLDRPTSPLIRSFLAGKNPLDQESVDRVLEGIRELSGGTGGKVYLNGKSPNGTPASPSATGLQDADALRANGWIVRLNGSH